MASLTVRQLDERLKKLLRLRAAKSGRSVEDEVRTILRAAAEETGTEASQTVCPPAPGSSRRAAAEPAAGTKRVLLIIGGGIAAYKSLDLIRRLKERGLAVRCVLTKAAEHFVTPLSAGAIVGERVFTPTCSIRPANSTSAISASRAKPIWSWWRRPPPT